MSGERTHVLRAARILRTVGHPLRFAIVSALGNGGKTVTDLIRITRAAQPTVSHQLSVLRRVGVVRCAVEGTSRRYSLAVPMQSMIACAIEGARRISGGEPRRDK